MQQKHQPLGPSSTTLALITCVLWGGLPAAIKFSGDNGLPPVAMAGIRFAMAAVFMVIWCRIEGSEIRLRKGQVRPAFIAGLLLFFQISTFTVGVSLTNSSHGSLFINTFVFWVVVIEHFITRDDRLSPRKLLGLLLAAGSVGLILWITKMSGPSDTRDQPTVIGDALLLVSGLLLGVKVVYVKHALKLVEPGKLILWHSLFGVAFFIGWSMVREEISLANFSTPVILGLLYQGAIVSGFCFAVQALLLRKHTASQISIISFSTPLFGIAIGFFFRGDQLSSWLWVSGACVAVGILLVNLAPLQRNKQ